ncbi:MAG: sodium-dependent bicarbonate transport family permease, partial [Betaproteobacteria bacterium]|nr:sodium-dependent bicarbonate transport family permease [Betaproteobacteria bacterium]
LMALGLKGGFALAHSGFTPEVATSLGSAVALAVVIPLIGFVVLKNFLSGFDAAAVAATYGSVSAVTFVTAVQYLDNNGIAFGGHMAAAMALMESPAIILAVIFANSLRQQATAQANLTVQHGVAVLGTAGSGPSHSLKKILHESFTDGAQLLLLGAMLVGWISGDAGKTAMQPFSGDLFKGMLAFFLLDMGLMTARSMHQLKGISPVLIIYAVLAPIVHAALALCIALITHASRGDATLLMVLAASASYIAVPAVLRTAIPEAKPSLYFGMSLGITFPLNLLIGIPSYTWVSGHFFS